MPVDHYENFPVASYLLPPTLRHPVALVYRFARTADDIADEGVRSDEERLAGLAAMAAQLDQIDAGLEPNVVPDQPFYVELAALMKEYALPSTPFRALLSAFSQDVVLKQYATYADVLDYCSRSANPVGRIMLGLYRSGGPSKEKESDAICTALQLINFWQDAGIDRWIGRIYIPREDLDRFKVSVNSVLQGEVRGPWHALLQFQIERTRALMLEGAPLALALPGRIGWELRMVVQGGLRILEKIEMVDHDVFGRRPKLMLWDWCVIAWRAFRMRA